MLMILAAALIPVNIVLLLASNRMVYDVRQQMQQSLQGTADVFMNALDARMQQVDYYIYTSCMSDPDFVEMQNAENEDQYISAKVAVHRKLLSNISVTKGCSGYFICFPDDKDTFLVGTSDLERKNLEHYLEKTIPETRRWTLEKINGKEYLMRIAGNGNLYYGACIEAEPLVKEVMKSAAYDSEKVFFCSSDTVVEGTDAIFAISASKRGAVKFCIQIDSEEVQRNFTVWDWGQLAISILFLILLPVVYISIRQMTVKTLQKLNKAHQELEKGNEAYRITQMGNITEFAEAYASFNHMADNIHSLKLENMEKELAKSQLELKNLQLQIRPHFLLNMFNLIYNLVAEKNTEDIREVIMYLTGYFRYLFRSGKELELFQKEFDLIQGYIKTSQIRYPDEIDCIFQIDPDVFMVRVPPLLIHNFVENIIKHAYIKGKPMHIMLSAEYVDGVVTFLVSDDGKGMSAEEVENINSGQFRETEGEEGRVHVGLKNSDCRLKAFYGEKACIQVESEMGEGTVFTISFPYNLEVEDAAIDY